MIKAKNILVPLAAFIIVIALHLLYFKMTEESCESIGWIQRYVGEREIFLGVSYALSAAFIAFSFLKFKEGRKGALKAAGAGGFFALILWVLCFLSGCCGSPMLIVYLNLFGVSILKIPKIALLFMTVAFITIGYFRMIKTAPENCYGCKPCGRDQNEKI